MQSSSKRYTIVFNGEIYNFNDLKNSSIEKNISFNSTSDTEALVEYIECFGLFETLSACIGMFSFALWDNYKQTLTLCRDRIGEKPLYYGWSNDLLLFFSSELKLYKIRKFEK